MTWAVTLDFHNTLAHCDAWFELEVYELIPAFFSWYESNLGVKISPEMVADSKQRYRDLRRRVMDTGVEVDAAASVLEVIGPLELGVSPLQIEKAMFDIFHPTVEPAKPMPGVVDAVTRLHTYGFKLAVVSSAAYHPFLEWSLRKFGILECFEAVLTSASTGYYKTSPKIYEAALQSLAVAPQCCVHVGDSERFDVQPARSLGMRTVLVGSTQPSKCADLQVSSLVGLPEALMETFGLPIDL